MPGANQFETTIVGGGVAGLTAALRLAERGVAVTVLEKGPLVGGNLSGVRHVHAYYDVYPHMFCEWYNNFWDLVEDLGLSRRHEFEKRPVCGLLREHDFPNYRCFTDAGSFSTFIKNLNSGVLTVPETFIADYTILDLLSQGDFRRGALENQTLNDFVTERYYATPAVTDFFNATVTNVWSIDSYLSSARAYQTYAKYQFRQPTPQCWVLRRDSYEQLITPLLARLDELGARVKVNTDVRGVTVENHRVTSISYTEEGGAPHVHHVHDLILAVPPASLADIIFAKASDAAPGGTIISVVPELANVRRLTSVPLPLLYVTFRHRLHDIPEYYVALLNSKYSLTFVEVKHLSEREHTTVLALAASDFNALPVDLDSPLTRDGHLDPTDWMANPALSEAAYLMLRELRNYVPFRLGHSFRDPNSDVDWDNTFFQPNLDQQLFINEVGSERYCSEVNYPAIENLYFAGDTCVNPIAVATVELGVYSGLQAASAIARRHRLRPVHMSVPQSYPAPLLWPWKVLLQPYVVAAKMWADLENVAGVGSMARRHGGPAHRAPFGSRGIAEMWAECWTMMEATCRRFW